MKVITAFLQAGAFAPVVISVHWQLTCRLCFIYSFHYFVSLSNVLTIFEKVMVDTSLLMFLFRINILPSLLLKFMTNVLSFSMKYIFHEKFSCLKVPSYKVINHNTQNFKTYNLNRKRKTNIEKPTPYREGFFELRLYRLHANIFYRFDQVW